MIEAVVFDLDGVLIDSEPKWEQERRQVMAEYGGRWSREAQHGLMGMSTAEWASYLSQDLGVGLPPGRIAKLVIERMTLRYDDQLTIMKGAIEAVRGLAERWPLGLTSSSPRVLIDTVLDAMSLTSSFVAVMSSDQVALGKPAPGIYLAIACQLGRRPEQCVTVEDSTNGMHDAAKAGFQVVAIPNKRHPPDRGVLRGARLVLTDLGELTPGAVSGLRENLI